MCVDLECHLPVRACCAYFSRAVGHDEGAAFAKENGLIFLETSAKTAAHVEEVGLGGHRGDQRWLSVCASGRRGWF